MIIDPWPRALTREQAAYYIGLTVPEFEAAIVSKEMPASRLAVDGKAIWDRLQLDDAFRKLPHVENYDPRDYS